MKYLRRLKRLFALAGKIATLRDDLTVDEMGVFERLDTLEAWVMDIGRHADDLSDNLTNDETGVYGRLAELEDICARVVRSGVIPREPINPSIFSRKVDVTGGKGLHTRMIDLIDACKLSVPSAKALAKHFKVARLQDLTADQVAEGHAMVDKMVATVSDATEKVEL